MVLASLSVLLTGLGVAAALFLAEAETIPVPAPVRVDPAQTESAEAPSNNTALDLLAEETPSPEPVEATATFEEHHRKDSGGALWVYGMVTNTSAVVIDKVEVIAVLKDEAGAELGTKSGFARRDALAPGESSPVVVLLKDTPDFATISWELDVDEASYVPEMVRGLRVEARPPTRGSFGGWEAEGKVHHDGEQPARFVKVEIQGWSSDGRLIGLSDAYIKDETLAPGASSRFKHVGVLFDEAPARFEMVVEGRAAN